MIVDNALYHQGKRVPLGPGDDQSLGSARVPCDPGDFQWIGIHDPSHDELQLIAKTFDLHPLAVEDAGDSHQRPKLERYDDTLFLVLKTLWYVDEEDAVETGEINMFVGKDFVVTVRHGKGIDLDGTVSLSPATDVSGLVGLAQRRALSPDQRGLYTWLIRSLQQQDPGFDHLSTISGAAAG